MSSQAAPRSPGSVLYRERDSRPVLPVCDHYCGSPALLAKSLALQGRLGPVLDITADCEDGAPAGDELGHALRMAQAMTLRAIASTGWVHAPIRSSMPASRLNWTR